MITEAEIFAYLDGEIDDADRDRIEQAIAADPALQAMVDDHRALAMRLSAGFATILQAPVPPALTAAVAAHDQVISLADERVRRQIRKPLPAASQWAALAATLAAAIVGGALFHGRQAEPGAEPVGQPVASGQLAVALDRQLASTQTPGEAIRIGLTFRDHGGVICRSFAAAQTEGVACHAGGAWRLRGLSTHDRTGTGDYRMAAASSGAAALVDRLIAGEALDQAQERAAMATGWATRKTP